MNIFLVITTIIILVLTAIGTLMQVFQWTGITPKNIGNYKPRIKSPFYFWWGAFATFYTVFYLSLLIYTHSNQWEFYVIAIWVSVNYWIQRLINEQEEKTNKQGELQYWNALAFTPFLIQLIPRIVDLSKQSTTSGFTFQGWLDLATIVLVVFIIGASFGTSISISFYAKKLKNLNKRLDEVVAQHNLLEKAVKLIQITDDSKGQQQQINIKKTRNKKK